MGSWCIRPRRRLKSPAPSLFGDRSLRLALTPKEHLMQIPEILQGESLRRLLQGAIAGVLATVIIGFYAGGWMLGSTAAQMAQTSANTALVAVLAPMCAERFRSASEATVNRAQLKRVSSWMQDSYIEKGGWATFPGMSSPDRGIAQACANLLT